MCRYCETDEFDECYEYFDDLDQDIKMYDVLIGTFGVNIVRNSDAKWYLVSSICSTMNHIDTRSIEIHFCPFCGKELS